MSASDRWDEFDLIGRLFRPLAEGAPEALQLRDDAAVIPARPGQDLVVTTDALVEGVHFLRSDPPDLVARKLLRVNLSDLAAKGAEPYGYFLTVAWPERQPANGQELFAAGLSRDQRTFGLKLFGGDTVTTPGPWTLSATMLGWVPKGRLVARSGARVGDLLVVSGAIGDAALGLRAAQGGLLGLAAWETETLIHRYRLPNPRLDLAGALRGMNSATDISDGLLADAGNLAQASGLAVDVDLGRLPLSAAGSSWVAGQDDKAAALLSLATGGDDYELVCASAVEAPGFTVVGRFARGAGVRASYGGQPLEPARLGYRHGKDG